MVYWQLIAACKDGVRTIRGMYYWGNVCRVRRPWLVAREIML